MIKQPYTFLDLFAGVGGFRLGLEKAGHKCIGFCEIDRKARESYKAIHNTENEVEMHDITTISDEFIRGIGRVDILAGGFPCQAFSVAGKRKGFGDTRGTLFFEIARFAHILRPKYLFLENVKGLLNHEGGATFETILRTLDELGYNVEWQLLNSKNYVAQNRERIFIIGRLRGECTNQIFPITGEESAVDQESAEINSVGTTNPKQIVVGNANPSSKGMNGNVYSSEAISPTITCNHGEGSKIAIPILAPNKQKVRQNGRRCKENDEEMFTLTAQDRHGIIVEGNLDGGYRSASSVVSTDGISPTLTTMGGGGQEPKILVREATKKGYTQANPGDSINFSFPNSTKRRGRVGKQYAHTLLTGEQQAVVMDNFQIRKLTPLECWRLQAFPDEAFLAAKFGSREIAKKILVNQLDHYNCDYKQTMSDSQLYKQAGNSVTVVVIYDIAKRL
ncbi:DNA (cytosine-5-)-methyltransferase [Enterococcus faecalis]|uniref:DNA (cytosine-5-)-methyltransferase n=2 Tax=Enterococcus TaxID=1350 RepID=UPI000CF164F3|nr:DNA (cytosine-5-)-methyltransferase [Enterococcus faecalis]EGO2809094.1 DNA (cytosine-5-)-methyltransferase [Enterococcus faecalis]EGO6640906.1 DNA (cytosine-5-)-methyltransferase [Enterococcus faecalis]EGO6770767.1 DNA (cytosine-5-)-methyltransferase [Enterococcus faecalis]EGO7724373.1 DNA (cytosine-5-)-methyltransferase [Enterococcus faecalis]EGO7759557.1 DNA (cytosine-5-)-methyltransferase [Enterococcus faecalis]